MRTLGWLQGWLLITVASALGTLVPTTVNQPPNVQHSLSAPNNDDLDKILQSALAGGDRTLPLQLSPDLNDYQKIQEIAKQMGWNIDVSRLDPYRMAVVRDVLEKYAPNAVPGGRAISFVPTQYGSAGSCWNNGALTVEVPGWASGYNYNGDNLPFTIGSTMQSQAGNVLATLAHEDGHNLLFRYGNFPARTLYNNWTTVAQYPDMYRDTETRFHEMVAEAHSLIWSRPDVAARYATAYPSFANIYNSIAKFYAGYGKSLPTTRIYAMQTDPSLDKFDPVLVFFEFKLCILQAWSPLFPML